MKQSPSIQNGQTTRNDNLSSLLNCTFKTKSWLLLQLVLKYLWICKIALDIQSKSFTIDLEWIVGYGMQTIFVH